MADAHERGSEGFIMITVANLSKNFTERTILNFIILYLFFYLAQPVYAQALSVEQMRTQAKENCKDFETQSSQMQHFESLENCVAYEVGRSIVRSVLVEQRSEIRKKIRDCKKNVKVSGDNEACKYNYIRTYLSFGESYEYDVRPCQELQSCVHSVTSYFSDKLKEKCAEVFLEKNNAIEFSDCKNGVLYQVPMAVMAEYIKTLTLQEWKYRLWTLRWIPSFSRSGSGFFYSLYDIYSARFVIFFIVLLVIWLWVYKVKDQ